MKILWNEKGYDWIVLANTFTMGIVVGIGLAMITFLLSKV